MNKKNAEEKVRVNRILMIDEAIRSGCYPTATHLLHFLPPLKITYPSILITARFPKPHGWNLP
jgi:hypothetical protein